MGILSTDCNYLEPDHMALAWLQRNNNCNRVIIISSSIKKDLRNYRIGQVNKATEIAKAVAGGQFYVILL